jgi:hypothetical protein
MPEKSEKYTKIGATALAAAARQGLAEFRAALPLADSPITQPPDYGMWGVATPGEVSEARREEAEQIDDKSVIGSRLNRIGPAEDRGDRGRDDRSRGIDRE